MLTEDQLSDALDGLHAYDLGCASSGIRDELLRQQVKEQLRAMPDNERRALLARLGRQLYLSDEKIAQGYSMEDIGEFARWLDRQGLLV